MSTSTPSRLPSTSSPVHQRTATNSSASSFPPSTPSGSSGPAAAITLEGLLTAHAADQDPKLAALEHAVSERNTLSSQNAQLWKLIEKQRTGYNQILKELERVRSERDGYKAKLGAIVGVQSRSRKETLNGEKEKEIKETDDSHPPPPQRQSPVVPTPQPPNNASRHIPSSSTSTITPSVQPPPAAPIVTPPTDLPIQTLSPQQTPNNSMLAALNGSRAQPLSRESRISLPDEARHYITTMGESPVPSPNVDAFAPRALPNAPSDSEFLDLEEIEEGSQQDGSEEEDSPQFDIQTTTQPLYAPRKIQNGSQDRIKSDSPGESPPTIQQQIQQQRSMAQQQQQLHTQQQPPPPLIQPQPSETLAPLQPLRPQGPTAVPASFRALPLLSSDLPSTTITVSHSFVRPNDRGKEVLSFVVHIDPGHNKEGWKVEKLYSDVIALDQRVRNSVGKTMGKKMVTLPEGKLWKDHAPAKVDQRKAILETYLQALVNLPIKSNDEVIAFFTSDIIRDYKQPIMQAGHKEGYLTKRGKNFGGWKTRFFVLQGPILEYYDCRGGAHLGSIAITGAQIGRQQRSDKPATDEEKEYRHAFLIVEAKKGPGGNHPRHVLCAESDIERDAWVEILVRYFSGFYNEEPVSYGQALPSTNATSRPSADVSYGRPSSPARSLDSPIDRQAGASIDSPAARRILESQSQQRQQPSSLPDSSPLSNATTEAPYQRANSELGHYSDPQNGTPRSRRQHSPEHHRREGPHKGFQPTLNTVASSPITPVAQQVERQERPPSPDSKVKISGPMNGTPIPAGYKFGGKDAPPPQAEPSTPAGANDRREKAKSRSFWGFGRPGAGGEKLEKGAPPSVATFAHRAVFGVSLEESLDVAEIAHLPAIVFRCIQYLEAKKADQEEGIYRLSGSSAVIKSLKDRFNMEGDIDLVSSDEYWDPHAIAGLLKSFLRELPASILTHNLHMKFLSVIDFVDPQERIKELAQLIAALPFANYSLLRALTAHLILIVQNATVNKMTMRNVGIVFSPTLGIPAPLFNLMLSEFTRVFRVDDEDDGNPESKQSSDTETSDRRNSRQYTTSAADQLLGLSGRTLPASDEGPSDDDSIQYESGTETTEENATAESSSSSPVPGSLNEAPPPSSKPSKATTMASAKGLSVSLRGNRYSTMMGGNGIGLPASPRPPSSPRAVPPDA
ncbi:hypothetical protein MIND_00330400 [Mycena indigotica]|uniref:RhoGAP-domain-containing protein n=1 Tax=Mycena indigotica TaxID=2126181 RepID=A0A8H6WEL4_9AGAR|nr:uncharacterized protein MIND_00330400 [Mycena indigotica]KAF7309594.1 hypothetical protein MIND_00330400 [Mycena indigotica]